MKQQTPLIPEAEITLDLQALAVESMGWIPIADKTYLHMGEEHQEDAEVVITVVGKAEDVQPGTNVMWVMG